MSLQQHPIPKVYRVTFNWIEPVSAISGAISAYWFSAWLTSVQTPKIQYDPIMHPFYTQLTGSWFLLAFHDLFLLRATRNVAVWRLSAAAGLISDIFWIMSTFEGREESVWEPETWSQDLWLSLLMTLPVTAVKIACTAGLWFEKDATKKRQ